jgi:hypothetical protein
MPWVQIGRCRDAAPRGALQARITTTSRPPGVVASSRRVRSALGDRREVRPRPRRARAARAARAAEAARAVGQHRAPRARPKFPSRRPSALWRLHALSCSSRR